jgi:lysophospholipase L1-like esterase
VGAGENDHQEGGAAWLRRLFLWAWSINKILMNKPLSVLRVSLALAALLGACGGDGKKPDAAAPDGAMDVNVAFDSGIPDDANVSLIPGDASSDGDATSAVTVTLNENAFAFDTPDQKHRFVATVTDSSPAEVIWSSSNSYIAAVDTTGLVSSVSGGEAVITVTSTKDKSKSASARVSVAEPNRARAASYVDAKSITSGSVSIILCGDSLTRTYAANAADQTGWGQVLGEFLSKDAVVDNTLAVGGRSSRSFYNEVGRWDAAKDRLAAAKSAGTPAFVFIMFGHNDQKKVTDSDGSSYLTFASQNPNGTVAGTYYDYLERYIVETRELGGVPILFTPFVREYLEGTPQTVTLTGQHNIIAPYAGEATARGDYPAAVKAVAQKHDVPVVDITAWSRAMVEARAAAGTLSTVYLSGDQTHVRQLGALLMAEETLRSLNAQGILVSYGQRPGARIMLDANELAFGGLYAGNTVDKAFRITPYGDVTGALSLTAPAGYTLATDGKTFAPTTTIACDNAYAGSVVSVRFAPSEALAYNGDLVVAHTTIVPSYGNTPPNAKAGVVSLTGNGKLALVGAPATATWPMFSGTTITLAPTTDGAISAEMATLVGLVNKNVNNGGARFDRPEGTWIAEGARNPERYIQFTVPVKSGTFTLDSISLAAGSGGGSNMRWDIVYSLNADFSSPTTLGTAINSGKDTLFNSNYPSLGMGINAGQTLTLRLYPYNTSAGSGKSIMVANVVISGTTG